MDDGAGEHSRQPGRIAYGPHATSERVPNRSGPPAAYHQDRATPGAAQTIDGGASPRRRAWRRSGQRTRSPATSRILPADDKLGEPEGESLALTASGSLRMPARTAGHRWPHPEQGRRAGGKTHSWRVPPILCVPSRCWKGGTEKSALTALHRLRKTCDRSGQFQGREGGRVLRQILSLFSAVPSTCPHTGGILNRVKTLAHNPGLCRRGVGSSGSPWPSCWGFRALGCRPGSRAGTTGGRIRSRRPEQARR
jgi:hypothetical protein